MQTSDSIDISTTSTNYEERMESAIAVFNVIRHIEDILMLLILIAFTVYIVKHRRRERFELLIIFWMTIKYVTGTINHCFYDKMNELEKNIFYGLYFSASSITQWIYASQYMKTCILIPGLFNKANLLMKRHITADERECELTASNNSFLRKNSEIDADIKAEKVRNREIDKTFYSLDIAVVIAILCCNGLFEYLMNHTSKSVEHGSQIAQQFFFPTLDVLTALILAFSANYLSK